MTKYEIILYWSDEDVAYIAEVPELAGCAADGATRQEAPRIFCMARALHRSGKAHQFVAESSSGRIPQQLVRYAFETFDNLWLSPEWWESLPAPEREFLVDRINTGSLPYAAGTADPYSLRDNGMSFVDWTLKGVETAFC